MSFAPPQSLAENIADFLTRKIINGELLSGERIQEARVVNELQVSRGPVREALILLESRHMVTIQPRKGACVSVLTKQQVEHLYEIYVHLLILLTEKVSTQWTDTTIKPLLAQYTRIQTLAEQNSHGPFVEAGFQLMSLALPLAENPYLSESLIRLQPAIHRTYALALRYREGEILHALHFFDGLLQSVLARAPEQLPPIIKTYGDHQCHLVLESLDKLSMETTQAGT